MYIERGNGTRVRIPNEVEAKGQAAVDAFLADPPPEAIEPSEPEPIPAEHRTADVEVRALAARHAIDLGGIRPTGPAGLYRREDIEARLPAEPAEAEGAAASDASGTSTRRGGRGAAPKKES